MHTHPRLSILKQHDPPLSISPKFFVFYRVGSPSKDETGLPCVLMTFRAD